MRRKLDARRVLGDRRGYVLIAVLCVFLVFTVLGANVLGAAYATVGTVSKKKTDSQAYLLASSSLVPLQQEIEKGSFKTVIDGMLTAIKANPPAGSENGALFDASAFAVTVTSEPLSFAQGADEAVMIITFTLNNARLTGAVPPNPAKLSGMLTARITARYGASEYAMFADFSPLTDPADPAGIVWKLQGFRGVRGADAILEGA